MANELKVAPMKEPHTMPLKNAFFWTLSVSAFSSFFDAFLPDIRFKLFDFFARFLLLKALLTLLLAEYSTVASFCETLTLRAKIKRESRGCSSVSVWIPGQSLASMSLCLRDNVTEKSPYLPLRSFSIHSVSDVF